jgi:hypothetical protein
MSDPKILIPLLRKHLPKIIAQEIVGVQPMSIRPKVPETWQGYLRRLGNGLNGVATNKYITEADIVENAQKYMQIKYPGNYTVEPYYNTEMGRFDLRLKFDDPKEEIVWLLRWS